MAGRPFAGAIAGTKLHTGFGTAAKLAVAKSQMSAPVVVDFGGEGVIVILARKQIGWWKPNWIAAWRRLALEAYLRKRLSDILSERAGGGRIPRHRLRKGQRCLLERRSKLSGYP